MKYGAKSPGDRYGSYNAGKLITSEKVAGVTITKQLPGITVDYPYRPKNA